MTKPITNLLMGILLLCAAVSRAQQPTFTLTPQTFNKNVGETVLIEVKVSNFQSIFSMQYGIRYRNTILQLDSIRFPNPLALTADDNGADLGPANVSPQTVGATGIVNTSWFSGSGQTLPNNTTLYKLYFKVLTSSADTIRFGKLHNGLNIEVGYEAPNGGLSNVGMVQNNSLKVGTIPPPVGWALLTDPASGTTGDIITVPVKVQEFTKITLMQYYTFWDKTKLEFQGIQDINLTDMNSSSFIPSPINTPANITNAANLGRLGLSWFDNSPTLAGVTVINGTAIYKMKFKILGATGTTTSITFGPNPPSFPTEVATKDATIVFQAVPCTVTVTAPPPPSNPVTFNMNSIVIPVLGTGCVDVTVKNFTKVVSAQYYIKFDKNLLTYNDVTVYTNLPDLPVKPHFSTPGPSNTAGVINFGYQSADPVCGTTFPDDTKIFSLCFTAKAAATSPTTVNLTMTDNGASQPVEVIVCSGQSGLAVTPVLNNGSIKVETVIVPCSGLNVAIDSTKNILCKGQSNGKIFITASGGTGAWNYQWTGPNGYSSTGIADISGLKAGIYNLTATNSTCPAITKTVTLTEPDAISIPTQNVMNVKCFGGSDGAITIVPAGGTAPMTYKWSGPMAFMATTQNISGLKAGTYQVTITDANGCTFANPIQVAQATPTAMNSNLINVTSVKCFGGSDGAILLNNAVTGGTQPYIYNWSGTNGYIAATKDIGGLKAGQYTCTVTDAFNCTPLVIGPINVSQPTTDLTITITSTKDATCGAANGEACVTITGGTSPYTQTWNGQGQTGLCLTSRPAGNYPITVQDANGCIKTLNVTIGGSTTPISQTGISVSQVSCNGGNDGSACITVTGGNGPYTYNWNPTGQTASCANNLPAGTYAVTVTDTKGCTLVAPGITVSEQPLIVLTSSVNIALGCIDLSVSGGTPPYQYLWSGNAGTNQDPCGLAAGTYTVTVTDTKNCTKTTTVSLQSSMAISVLSGDKSCANEINGSVIININGGTGPYTITWTNGGNSGSVTTSTSPYELGGLKGNESAFVTVTDAQGGSAIGQATVIQNPPITATISISNATNFPTFNNGSMLLEVTSGTPPYTFQWSKNGVIVTGNITSGTDTTKITLQGEGPFCVTVTDASGCSKEFCKNILNIYPQMVVTVNQTSPSCETSTNGALDMTISGGNGTYTVIWTLPNGTTQTTQDLTSLIEGPYDYQVKDGSGQIIINTSVLIANSHLAATADIVSSCGNGTYDICTQSICDGVGVVATTGSIGAVSYIWSNGETNQTASELCAGQNSVVITDAAGCSVTLNFFVTAPEAIEVNMPDPTANTCFGVCNGSAQVNPIGGVQPFTFLWSNQETGQIATKLCSGTNYVTVTDKFGISAIDTFEVAGPDSMFIQFTQVAPSDYETCDGTIIADVVGAQTPIAYFAWSKPNQFDAVVEDGCAGECLLLSVKDARGCIVSDTVCVEFPKDGCLVGSKVMTPLNPDGKNDVLFIACAEGYDDAVLEVYNRWGQLVFESKGYDNNWDGTFKGQAGKYLPEGVYFWVFTFEGSNGRVQRKDYVTILRGDN